MIKLKWNAEIQTSSSDFGRSTLVRIKIVQISDKNLSLKSELWSKQNDFCSVLYIRAQTEHRTNRMSEIRRSEIQTSICSDFGIIQMFRFRHSTVQDIWITFLVNNDYVTSTIFFRSWIKYFCIIFLSVFVILDFPVRWTQALQRYCFLIASER